MPNIPVYAEQQVRPVEPRFVPLSGAGATPDAFGAGIAEEMKRFGQVNEQNASRFEQQAQALQTQDNEAAANELTTQYLIKQSAITEEFKQLQGADPKAAMEKYTRDLTELRAGMRGTVPNAEVGRMFDRETQRQFGYAVMNGSSYAATQMRQYRDEQQKAVIDTKASTATTAANPKILKDQLDDLAESVRSSAAMRGKSPEFVEAEIRVQQAKVWGKWLPDLAENDPAAARQVLKANRDKMDGAVAQKLDDVVDQQELRVKAKEIAASVGGTAIPTPGSRATFEADARKKAQVYAKEQGLSPAKTEAVVQATVDTLDSWYNKQMATLADGQRSNRNTLVDFINGGNDGKGGATSLDDIIGPQAPAEVKAAWLAADPPMKQTLMDRMKRNAAAELSPTVPTPETIANRKRLSQLAVDDPDEFLKADSSKEKLTRSDLTWLINQQQKISQGKVSADEVAASKRSVDTAVATMRVNGLLDISGLRKEDIEKNPEKMAQLRGALVQELDAFNLQNGGRKPDEKDLLAIGKRIVRDEVSAPTTVLGVRVPFTGGSVTKTFSPEKAAKPVPSYEEIPDSDRERLAAGFKANGIEATRQNYRLYYQKLLEVRTASGKIVDRVN